MEITWTYNWLETVGFLFLVFVGGIFIFYGLGFIWLNGKFKGWW